MAWRGDRTWVRPGSGSRIGVRLDAAQRRIEAGERVNPVVLRGKREPLVRHEWTGGGGIDGHRVASAGLSRRKCRVLIRCRTGRSSG